MSKVKSLDEFKSEHNPDPEVLFLRGKVAELENKLKTQKNKTGEALELTTALLSAIEVAEPAKITYRKDTKTTTPCTHVMHITDWHYGMMQKKDEVDGFGEYSPDIAKQRVEALTSNIINKTVVQRNGYNVPELHIIGTGDYISGAIHKELEVNNAFPCPVQAVECGYLMGEMLMKFAPHFNKVTVDLVTLDNHGRLTRKPQASGGGENNWGYVVAQIAKQHTSRQSNMEVKIHAKPSALVTVGPERYLAFHGHQIKGWAGKPYYGFDRRAAMEAIKRMGVPEQAFTKMLLGHFHHAMNGDVWLLGGSLSGTDAFDHSCGRHSAPHQTAWFCHKKHGEFDWTRWWL